MGSTLRSVPGQIVGVMQVLEFSTQALRPLGEHLRLLHVDASTIAPTLPVLSPLHARAHPPRSPHIPQLRGVAARLVSSLYPDSDWAGGRTLLTLGRGSPCGSETAGRCA